MKGKLEDMFKWKNKKKDKLCEIIHHKDIKQLYLCQKLKFAEIIWFQINHQPAKKLCNFTTHNNMNKYYIKLLH